MILQPILCCESVSPRAAHLAAPSLASSLVVAAKAPPPPTNQTIKDTCCVLSSACNQLKSNIALLYMSVAPSARPFDPVHMEPFKVLLHPTPPPPQSTPHHVKPRTKKTRLTMPNSNLPTPAPQRGILALASPPACSSSCARPSCPSSSS